MKKPLEELLVLEFCQFLAGPSAGLRLADLGARVIKIERRGTGDACRGLAIKNLFVDDDSLLFHTINRNKSSYEADLKDPDDLSKVKKLIARADIMTHNFRPGIMEKIGLGFEQVSSLNPKIIYGVVSGYGNEGPWSAKPGQDLLVQSVSGLTYLSGSAGDGPVPFGLSVTDILCGNHLAQGLLAALIKRSRTGKGVLVEVSLLESALDLQFEVLTTYLNDGGKLPQRSAAREGAHAYLSAPYGLYQTSDGHIALAMGDLQQIAQAIGADLNGLTAGDAAAFRNRDEIIACLAQRLITGPGQHWLDQLDAAGLWCAPVLDYEQATSNKAYEAADIEQTVLIPGGHSIRTVVCPLRINGEKFKSAIPAPRLGAHNSALNAEFELN
ncbi:CaiB/BaiF CoA-transferase family protein [Pedobacter sp. SYP-B3415]|uniref:CaiB/BaiF CoA transferase family protein n=1 Tax=Pedobacter sp. SYP-B3415 TaxID=2496641 RepID=UPI00101D2657|nr:CaiB/BaiF CoA-transferase family protein [Pedobacter sp. SYP-B3415]